MITDHRRLTLLVVGSLGLQLLLISWLIRPISAPLSLPTLQVLLVSPKAAPSPSVPAPQALGPSPRQTPPAAGMEAAGRQGDPQPVASLADGPQLAQPRGEAGNNGGAQPLSPSSVLSIDRTTAVSAPQLADSTSAASPVDRQTANAGVVLAIRQQLARFQSYPANARRRGTEGSATVRFVISRRGELVDSELLESSGSRHLDQAAMKLVSDAAPYPPLPGVIGASRLEVKIPIEYRLKPPAT